MFNSMFYRPITKEMKLKRITRDNSHTTQNVFIGNGLDVLAMLNFLYPRSIDLIGADFSYLPLPSNEDLYDDKKFVVTDVITLSLLRLSNTASRKNAFLLFKVREEHIKFVIERLDLSILEGFNYVDTIEFSQNEHGKVFLVILERGMSIQAIHRMKEYWRNDISISNLSMEERYMNLQKEKESSLNSLFFTLCHINNFYADMYIQHTLHKSGVALKTLATHDKNIIDFIQENFKEYPVDITAAVIDAKERNLPPYIIEGLQRERGEIFKYFQGLITNNVVFTQLNNE